MEAAHEFLTTLALVLCVAGVATLIFQRLHQPVIFGYLLAGLIIGPYTPVPLVADNEITHTLAETGVILLMFSLGLEFTFRKLVKVGPTAGIIGLVQSMAMVWLGYLAGRALGWTSLESIYAGCIVAVSSTTIIIKAFQEQGIKERYTRLVFGVLIVEDLIAIFMLTILTAISGGQDITAGTIGSTALNLGMFLTALIGIGLLVVPRLTRVVVKLDKPETTLVTTIGICFACALLALEFGYSVALGAFIAGSLVAESGHGKAIEHLVQPVRDMFGAIFFVAVGMLIDPRLIMDNMGAVILMTLVVIAGKVVFVTFAAFVTGQGVKTSVQSGLSLAQIGEFSFIIAALGLSLGATGSFLYPIAVAVSAVTTLSTPLLIKNSARIASWIDGKLPRALQTYVALYGSWIERLRATPATNGRGKSRRLWVMLIVDVVLFIGLIILTAVRREGWTVRLGEMLNLTPAAAGWAVIAATLVVAAPLCLGILRITRVMSHAMSVRAFAEPAAGVDFAAAPRRAFEVTLHLIIVLMIGGLVVIVTQPFLPDFRGTAVLAIVLVALGVALWRSATNLQGHTRAGAEIFAMTFSRQLSTEEEVIATPADAQRLHAALPGLGEPTPVTIREGSAAVGKSLRQLDLRGTTGATVLAILHRDGAEVLLPDGRELLHAGDVLFVAGTHRCINAARALL